MLPSKRSTKYRVPFGCMLYTLHTLRTIFARVTEFLGLDILENITAAMLQDVSTSEDLSHNRCATD